MIRSRGALWLITLIIAFGMVNVYYHILNHDAQESLKRIVAQRDQTISEMTHERDVLRMQLDFAQQTKTPQPTQITTPQPSSTPNPNPEKDTARPFLIIGIPTVPRKKATDYLSRVLASMEKQISGGVFEGRVRVVIMNNRPRETHVVYDRMKEKYKDYAAFEFVENFKPLADTPVPTREEFAESQHQVPDDAVRRQTLDVISLLNHVHGKSSHFMFYEDDFILCENGLMAVDYMIRKADLYAGVGKWTAIRCSFGLNGIIMQNNNQDNHHHNDLDAFRKYLAEHFARRPPDHLVVEWFAKESKQSAKYFGADRYVMAFRYNIAYHIGMLSTIREQQHWSFPGCFHELIAPQVFPVEAWNPVDCPGDDMWPCDSRRAVKSYLMWNTSTEALVSGKRNIYLKDGTVIERKPID